MVGNTNIEEEKTDDKVKENAMELLNYKYVGEFVEIFNSIKYRANEKTYAQLGNTQGLNIAYALMHLELQVN